MDVKAIPKKIASEVSKNLPTITTVTSVIGLFMTVGLTIKTAPRAKNIYEERLAERPNMTTWNKIQILAPLYWPVLLSGGLTAGSIILSNRVSTRRTAAAIAAYQVSEAALASFREAAVKTVGKKKTEDIEYTVAADKIRANPASANSIFVNENEQLCYDSISGRYFSSTKNKIESAINTINKRLISETTVSLNEFYELIGLSYNQVGYMLGWNMRSMNDILEVTFSAHLTDDGRTALVIDYDVAPTYDYEYIDLHS